MMRAFRQILRRSHRTERLLPQHQHYAVDVKVTDPLPCCVALHGTPLPGAQFLVGVDTTGRDVIVDMDVARHMLVYAPMSAVAFQRAVVEQALRKRWRVVVHDTYHIAWLAATESDLTHFDGSVDCLAAALTGIAYELDVRTAGRVSRPWQPILVVLGQLFMVTDERAADPDAAHRQACRDFLDRILRDGPEVGIHVLLGSHWYPADAVHEFAQTAGALIEVSPPIIDDHAADPRAIFRGVALPELELRDTTGRRVPGRAVARAQPGGELMAVQLVAVDPHQTEPLL